MTEIRKPVFNGICDGGPMDGRRYSADQPTQVFTIQSTPSAHIDVAAGTAADYGKTAMAGHMAFPKDVSSGTYEWSYARSMWEWKA